MHVCVCCEQHEVDRSIDKQKHTEVNTLSYTHLYICVCMREYLLKYALSLSLSLSLSLTHFLSLCEVRQHSFIKNV